MGPEANFPEIASHHKYANRQLLVSQDVGCGEFSASKSAAWLALANAAVRPRPRGMLSEKNIITS
jgi:hypothetical protein